MKVDPAIDYIDEALTRRITEFAFALEFGGVLRERGADSRADVDDGGGGFHPGQGSPHESVGSEQEMIALVSATCVAEIMHDGPSIEIRVRQQVGSTNAGRILWPWRRRPVTRIL
jgi:hypothetical protein